MTRCEQQIEFLMEIDKLKSVERQTLLVDCSRRENSAEHSWHLALMAQVLAEHAAEPVDVSHATQMALAHDLVEIDAGDTYVYDAVGNQDKAERELRAAVRIFSLLPTEQAAKLRALWDEFEAVATPESRFANALDRLQPLLNNWRSGGAGWRGRNIRRTQVLQRMEPVRLGLPALWPLVIRILDEAAAAGWLREE
jgi:putative hydrolase of HD superfamily